MAENSERKVIKNDVFGALTGQTQLLHQPVETQPATQDTPTRALRVVKTEKEKTARKRSTKRPTKKEEAQAVTPPEAPGSELTTSDGQGEPTPDEQKIPKKRIAFYVPEDMAEEIQSAVVHLAGYPHMMNMGKIAELAFPPVLEQLRQQHNKGKPFPPLPPEIKATIKGGRPVGS